MGYADGMSSITSSSSGNLCSSSLENTRRPSTKTSKAPRAPVSYTHLTLPTSDLV